MRRSHVFEIGDQSRRPLVVAAIFLMPLVVLLVTPMIRPFRWSRLFWTYLVPAVPFLVLFDGVVSCLRTYTPDELRELTRGLGDSCGPTSPSTAFTVCTTQSVLADMFGVRVGPGTVPKIVARVSRAIEAARICTSAIRRNKGMWTVTVTVKGGRKRELPLPDDVKEAIDGYLELDAGRRAGIRRSKSAGEPLETGERKDDGTDAPVFQSLASRRNSEEPLSVRSVRRIVECWADYSKVGRPRADDSKTHTLSPHDLRRTAITRAYDLGPSGSRAPA
jgi:hypothetical protein